MASSLESLEEKFRKVEQASEHRVNEPRMPPHMELVTPVGTSTESRTHQKKLGISVSQFGKQGAQEDGDGQRSPTPSPLFAAASKSTFYHALANPRSIDSLISADAEETRHTEEQHEIQVERIAGRPILPKTVGALLPRRLTRTQSQLGCVPISKCTVVDVLVETTTESLHVPPNSQTSTTAYVTRPSRPRAATMDVSATPHGGLVERARGFARKLRQKS